MRTDTSSGLVRTAGRILFEVLGHPHDAQEALIRQATEGDAPLRAEVLRQWRASVETTGHIRFDANVPDQVADIARQQRATKARKLVGRTLEGRYVLGDLVGSGGAGFVLEGRDIARDADVAVKVLGALSGEERRRVRAESAALRSLQVPGVVPLHDEIVEGERIHLVMDRLPGPMVGPELGPMAWTSLEPLARSLLQTLGRVHWAGFTHNDIKPANVLLDAWGRPALLDLGIADSDADPHLRALMAGTPRYLPPERFLGDPGSIQADLHAVGLILLEAITGERVFPEPSMLVLRQAKLTHRAEDRAAQLEHVPLAARTFLCALLTVKPDERPASARDALRLLGVPTPVADYPVPREDGRYTEAELKALFAGSDTFTWIPTDAAQALYLRTDGDPDEVVEEMAAWEDARLGRHESDGFVIERDTVDRLREGLVVRPRDPGAPAASLPEPGATWIGLIQQARSHLPREALQDATPDVEDMDAEVQRLVEAGWLVIGPDGEPWPGALTLRAALPDRDQARALRKTLRRILPTGSEAHLRTFLSADDPEGALRAALFAIRDEEGERPWPRDPWLLDQLLRVARHDLERVDLCIALLNAGMTHQRINFAVSRVKQTPLPDHDLLALESIIRMMESSMWGKDTSSVDAILHPAQGALGHRSAVMRRYARSIIWYAHQNIEPDTLRGLIESIYGPEGDAHSRHARVAYASLAGVEGRHHAAALIRLRMARATSDPRARALSLHSAAAGVVFAIRPCRLEILAKALYADARAGRHATQCVHAWSLRRRARYQSGAVVPPEPELLAQADDAYPNAVRFLDEAIYAWRAKAAPIARDMIRAYLEHPRRHGHAVNQMATAALLADMGDRPALTPEELRSVLADRIGDDGDRLEVICLARMGGGDLPSPLLDETRALAARMTPRRGHQRGWILSRAEIQGILRDA